MNSLPQLFSLAQLNTNWYLKNKKMYASIAHLTYNNIVENLINLI